MPKVYYNATGPNSFECVDSPEKAKPEPYKQAVEVTQKKLKSAELVELPAKTPGDPSNWVISADK
jgi:hypothetical protein